MNGADRLCDVLLVNGVNVCFANPGTSEMHFVAALDRKPEMRCILGLFEGVVTGAADGYSRMADKPAATLLHTGPGLANGLANLHNARRARTPIVNVVGDHASYHLQYDAPLTTDIESLARPMTKWVGRATGPETIAAITEQAYVEAMTKRGPVAMILPGDSAWNPVEPMELTPAILPQPKAPDADRIREAAKRLRSGKRAGFIISGCLTRGRGLEMIGRIAQAIGADLFVQRTGRNELGAGRVATRPIPYPVDMAVQVMSHLETVILCGATAPVGFFAYPGKPSKMLPESCATWDLATEEEDLLAAVDALADELGVKPSAPVTTAQLTAPDVGLPTGALDADAICTIIVRNLPEGAIVCDEAITSGRSYQSLALNARQHDLLPLMGGAIGIGIPLAAGAAVACPDRKVIGLQADGSGMYTIQGLWTQAREQLDVVTVVFSNRSYATLYGEMRNVGVNAFGRNARSMLDLDNPVIDWVPLARSLGVEARQVTTTEEFDRVFKAALKEKGPILIEAVMS